MSKVYECEVWYAPSSPNGKVWGFPIHMKGGGVTQTFNAAHGRFKKGAVTTNECNPMFSYDFTDAKIRKGYAQLDYTVWVDFDTGKVFERDPTISSVSGSLRNESKPPSLPEPDIEFSGGGSFNF